MKPGELVLPHQAVRRYEAFKLAMTGFSVTAIAKKLKCNRDTIARDLAVESARMAGEIADERQFFVRRQLQVLDTLENILFGQLDTMTRVKDAQGNELPMPAFDVRIISEIRKVEERRALLMGLDAPKQVQTKNDPATRPLATLLPLALMDEDAKLRLLNRMADYLRAKEESETVNVTKTLPTEPVD
jgi:hypothetical protein